MDLSPVRSSKKDGGGIIAAQSIGERNAAHHAYFHIGGPLARKFKRAKSRRNALAGAVRPDSQRREQRRKNVLLARTARSSSSTRKERELGKKIHLVPNGAVSPGAEDNEVVAGSDLPVDLHSVPILAEVAGVSVTKSAWKGIDSHRVDPNGHVRRTVIESKGDLHPQIILEDRPERFLDFYYLPERANIEVDRVRKFPPHGPAKPRVSGGTQDITGGLPRVTELSSRKPKDPAIIARSTRDRNRRGEETGSVIIIRARTGPSGSTLFRTEALAGARQGHRPPGDPLGTVRSCRTTSSASRGKRAALLLREARTCNRFATGGNRRQAHRDTSRRCAESPHRPRRDTSFSGIVIDKLTAEINQQLLECIKMSNPAIQNSIKMISCLPDLRGSQRQVER